MTNKQSYPIITHSLFSLTKAAGARLVFLVFFLCHIMALQARTDVVAAIPPVAWITDQIGGKHVNTTSLLESGQGPHTFQLRPSQMRDLGKAELYFFVGLPFERELAKRLKSNNTEIAQIDVTSGIAKYKSRAHDHVADPDQNEAHAQSKRDTEHHRADGKHDIAYDPHVWLDPLRAIVIAENIRDALIEVDPEHAAAYRSRYHSVAARLQDLHKHLLKWFKPVVGEKFYVYHPAFQYFARRYGLEEVAIEREGKSPGPRELSGVIKEARGMPVVFRQPQFSDESVSLLADAIGAKIQEIDPLAYDYESNLKTIGARIMTALRMKKNAKSSGFK